MIRSRFLRAMASAAIGLTLALTAMAGPSPVMGATPTWEIVSTVSLPPAVSPGSDAGYAVTIRNRGPSNISQLFLTTDAAAPNPTYADPSQGSCNASGPLLCNVGPLRKGRTVTVVVAFPTPATGASALNVNFVWNTTGLGSGGGDSSHGDELIQPASTSLNSSGDFSGAFVRGIPQVDNDTSLSNSNRQWTRVFVPGTNVPVTVADESAVVGNAGCPVALGCFTGTSEIHVANGAVFANGFKIQIGLDGSQLAPGTNANNLDFWHQFDAPRVVGGVTVSGELVTEACKFTGGSTTPKSLPCVDVTNAGGGDLLATLWLRENGRIQGW